MFSLCSLRSEEEYESLLTLYPNSTAASEGRCFGVLEEADVEAAESPQDRRRVAKQMREQCIKLTAISSQKCMPFWPWQACRS